MQKNWLRLIALITLILLITGLFRPEQPSDEETIYRSLDTMAEIMTLVNQHAPGQVSGEEMVEGAIDGLLTQLDPHSNFYNEERYRTMKEDQKGSFYGIGIIVGFQNEQLTVISPLDGSPAMRAGIRAGDVIVRIDEVVTKELDFYDAIRLLRGEEGSPVTVAVKRRKLEDPLVFQLNRAEVPSDNVRASFMLPQKTGYVALRDFGETAAREVAEAALTLEEAGMERMILDLRGNPGGLLPQAIQVASLFIPGKKLVVSTRGRLQNATNKYYSEKKSPLKQLPLIVLIDRGSASASEIVAGALQDHDRGLIVGVNSWGKGLVQSVFPLSDGIRGLALTTSRYYTPSGRNIQGSYDSLDAYYNPESSENQYFQPPSDKENLFRTTHGREVLEVRGITPDVYFSYRETPEAIQTLEAFHSAFFNFATEWQEKNGLVKPDWQPDDKIFASFTDFLEEQQIEHEDLSPHQEMIFHKIKYQCLYIHDAATAWEYLMNNDDHVKVAQELFGKAGELLEVYNSHDSVRPEYSEELRHFALLKKETRKDAGVPEVP